MRIHPNETYMYSCVLLSGLGQVSIPTNLKFHWCPFIIDFTATFTNYFLLLEMEEVTVWTRRPRRLAQSIPLLQRSQSDVRSLQLNVQMPCSSSSNWGGGRTRNRSSHQLRLPACQYQLSHRSSLPGCIISSPWCSACSLFWIFACCSLYNLLFSRFSYQFTRLNKRSLLQQCPAWNLEYDLVFKFWGWSIYGLIPLGLIIAKVFSR